MSRTHCSLNSDVNLRLFIFCPFLTHKLLYLLLNYVSSFSRAGQWTWILSYRLASPGAATPWLIGGSIGGFIVALVTIFNKRWAVVTAPIYAVLEGLVLGGLSSILEAIFPGIVIQAVGLTSGTPFCLLGA